MHKISNRIKHRSGETITKNLSDRGTDLDDICRDTWKELYRFVYYKVQNREEAEDITQETYAKAFDYMNRKDIAVLDYMNLLKTIAMNVIRDQWRIKKRKGNFINMEEINPESIAEEDFSGAATDRTIIEEAMLKLSEDMRAVITYRIINGYSAAETAGLMKKKEGTVRVLQYRALKALSKLLEGVS